VFDSKPVSAQERVKFSPKSLSKTRNWILENLHVSTKNEFPGKIFINRKAKYRNLINSKSVRGKLEEQGYEILECTEEFFMNQSEYFARANHVVAPGGAVLANILFMEKGSTITVLRSSRDSNLRLWKKLAQACGIDFNEVVGVPTYFGPKTLARQHSNYFLPLKRLNVIFLRRKFDSK
jgi:capsular polysaccharide biosynthesis protein